MSSKTCDRCQDVWNTVVVTVLYRDTDPDEERRGTTANLCEGCYVEIFDSYEDSDNAPDDVIDVRNETWSQIETLFAAKPPMWPLEPFVAWQNEVSALANRYQQAQGTVQELQSKFGGNGFRFVQIGELLAAE